MHHMLEITRGGDILFFLSFLFLFLAVFRGDFQLESFGKCDATHWTAGGRCATVLISFNVSFYIYLFNYFVFLLAFCYSDIIVTVLALVPFFQGAGGLLYPWHIDIVKRLHAAFSINRPKHHINKMSRRKISRGAGKIGKICNIIFFEYSNYDLHGVYQYLGKGGRGIIYFAAGQA